MPGASSGFLDFEDRAAERRQQAMREQALLFEMSQRAQVLQAAQQDRQRALQARAGAGQTLLGMGGGGGIPMPGQPLPSPGGGFPLPPVAGPPASTAPAPSPGSLSPGGGNPAAQQPAPQPQAQPAPVASPPPPQPIPPFRGMPSSPPATAAPSGIPMPQAPAQPDVTKPPDHFNVGKVVERMKAAGVPPDQALDQLDQLMPFIQANQKAELDHYRMTLSAQTAAMRAYEAEIRSYKAQTDAEIKRVAEERRTRQGDERTGIKRDELDLKRQREGRLRAAAATGTGTTGPLKATEFIYPKKDDGSADQTGEPIGIRGLTKTGKIVYLDAEGHQTPTLAGITAKQSKASSVAVKDTVRSNLVQGSANNAIRILDNIEKTYPDATTSVIFGQDPKGITESIVHAGARGMQGGRQQAVDAQWAAFIDEAIPVFTGGLRGSDAFRRFLIGQAPGPNAKPEVVKQKMQLFRDNIRGTQRAFSDKFKSDPSMWASGVTKEQVSGGGSAPGEAAAGAEERKTIGGKNYVKRDGQWFEE